MGCCFSRSAGPNSPYPGGLPSGSARAINPPAGTAPPISASIGVGVGVGVGGIGNDARSASEAPPARRHQHQHQHHREPRPLDQHIDKPLRRHQWTSRDHRAWTPRRLARERADFFDTRVAGRTEVWQALRSALQVLWDPAAEGAAADGSDGLATAQLILTAAEITLPTGDLAQGGAYDALGNHYALPEWVVADPSNLAADDSDDDSDDDDDDDEVGAGEDTKGGDITAGEETAEELEDDEVLRRREEKGKAVLDVKNLVAVQARLSENSQDVAVSVGKSESVRSVAHKIQDEAGLPSSKRVRLAYMGKILKEGASLADQGWKQGHVVNALVFNR